MGEEESNWSSLSIEAKKKQISRNLLKTMSNFFFCQAQLGINVHYREKKFKKVDKQKFKLALKLLKKS